MGIKNIHLTLIIVSVLLSIGFGIWTLNHNQNIWAYGSFIVAAALIVYTVQFVKKMKAL